MSTKTATKTTATTTVVLTDDVKELRKQRYEAAKAVSAPTSAVTQASSAPPPASTSAARVIRSDMLSNASGITLTGGTFNNVGGTIYREMPKNVAAPMPNAPHDGQGEENDHIIATAFNNLSKLTVTEGADVVVDNFGEELLPGQKPTSKKGGSIHSTMFEGLKDSVIGGGTFTCGGRVQYLTPSSGVKTPGEGI